MSKSARPAPAGYSGTPLVKKLGIKPNQRVFTIDAPKDYADLVAPLPDGATITSRAVAQPLVFAHVFVLTAKDLAIHLRDLRKRIADEGVIWVSWPKQASKV